jgi:TPR repeat protein
MTNCPFCGENFVEEQNKVRFYDNRQDALVAIMEQFGAEQLFDKLNSIFADIAPTVSKADKKLVYAVYENGATQILKRHHKGSQVDKERAVKIAIGKLVESHISEKSAQVIINEFVVALGWEFSCKPDSSENIEEFFNMGNRYKEGEGVEKNLEQAFEFFRKAAEQGHLSAQRELGLCYLDGVGIEKNDVLAVEWIRKVAEKGFAPAQRTYGYCFYKGKGVERDLNKSIYWYRKAAEQEDAVAQRVLGVRYREGDGVEANSFKAVYWFKKAAEQDDIVAMSNLGCHYVEGWGIKKDAINAMYWLTKAAERGHIWTQKYLGNLYEYGSELVEENIFLAIDWYKKAADQGDEEAVAKINNIYNPSNPFE